MHPSEDPINSSPVLQPHSVQDERQMVAPNTTLLWLEIMLHLISVGRSMREEKGGHEAERDTDVSMLSFDFFNLVTR